jgi:membrane fusion protein, multidrug efflux system
MSSWLNVWQDNRPTGQWRSRFHLLGVFFAVMPVAGAMMAAGCSQSPARGPEKKAPEVIVTTPITDQVTDYQDFTGRLDALKTVDIRARVSGFVLSAPFKEGDEVREGDVLFAIDPSSYSADTNLASANLKLAKADQNLQQKIAARARKLIGDRAMAQEDYDTAVATWEKSRASVEAMSATKERTQLYLDWTKVTAPLSGRVSRRLVDPGNLVTADNTILTTLVNDKQLYAYFDVDERTYLELVGARQGQSSLPAGLRFPVLMCLANEGEFARSGIVDFIDNRVNASTGTIRMRGVFENPKGLLRSGLFVRIRLPSGTPYTALLIPDEALLSDQGKKYVFVVNDKDEVVYRPVTLGQELKGLRVIKGGVSAGERVIITGMQRVRQGAKVQVKIQPPPKPPGSALTQLLKTNSPPLPATQPVANRGNDKARAGERGASTH